MFDHQAKINYFLERARQGADPNEAAAAFGVTIEPANVAPGEVYWRVIGIYHLEGSENHGQSNIFLEALDDQGRRAFPTWAGWTWKGRQDHEPARPVLLDKPASEPAGNINLGFKQTASVWIVGPYADSLDDSDKIHGLHTRHGGVAATGNYNGHHSFFALFQRTVKVEEGTGDDPGQGSPPPVSDWRLSLTPQRMWILENPHEIAGLIDDLKRLLDEATGRGGAG